MWKLKIIHKILDVIDAMAAESKNGVQKISEEIAHLKSHQDEHLEILIKKIEQSSKGANSEVALATVFQENE